jgi:hypothetical protein
LSLDYVDKSHNQINLENLCVGIEVNKIGTWFVGLILVLLMVICLMAFHVGVTAGQFKTLKATIIAKLREIRNHSLAQPPSYHQIVHEKQAQQ